MREQCFPLGIRGARVRAVGLSGALALLCAGIAGCAYRQAPLEPIRVVEDAHSGGNALAISADSRLGASDGWAGQIRLWRLPEGTPLTSWRTPHGDLSGLMFLRDGTRVLSTGHDGFVRIWDLQGGLVSAYSAGSAVTSFQALGDARRILLGHADGSVTYWSIDGTPLGRWELSGRRITAVAVDSTAAVFAAGDSARRVWRWRDGGPAESLQPPPTHVRSLSFNPADGGLLGAGWFDLFSWPSDGAGLDVLPTAHRGIVNHLAFSRDGRFVASISRQTDSSVLLLDPATGRTLATYEKHALCGQRVALSPDGRSMMSNSDDASVRFYALPASLHGDHVLP